MMEKGIELYSEPNKFSTLSLNDGPEKTHYP